MSGAANRGRMAQCETTCKILHALGAGRWTTATIADFAGVSVKTVRRYLSVLSIYFGVQEQREGYSRYYWLDDKVCCAVCKRASNNQYLPTERTKKGGLTTNELPPSL